MALAWVSHFAEMPFWGWIVVSKLKAARGRGAKSAWISPSRGIRIVVSPGSSIDGICCVCVHRFKLSGSKLECRNQGNLLTDSDDSRLYHFNEKYLQGEQPCQEWRLIQTTAKAVACALLPVRKRSYAFRKTSMPRAITMQNASSKISALRARCAM